MTTDITIRLAACALIRTRFAGRAALESKASNSLLALTQLEARLGLATQLDVLAVERETTERVLYRISSDHFEPGDRVTEALGYLLAADPAARERMAVRRYARASAAIGNGAPAVSVAPLVTVQIARVVNGQGCAKVDVLRANRKQAKGGDPLAARRPLHALRTIAKKRALEAYERAGFRTATHGHSTAVELRQVGFEGASSDTSKLDSTKANLPKSYTRRAFYVLQSEHTIRASVAIFRPEVVALNAGARGTLYLSATTRVRQGRGTSLLVEHLGANGAWS